ncbi:hypothetical protein [Frankia sp. CiP3]|uniref:hypothetical protein n=1 Tax=Frankia sp. CiP3 TaxID=2880971 RepID=UPI001EF59AEC|nr:hypothetical protein [Frankia sp. CiP3]
MTGTPQQRNQALATWIGKSGRSYQQIADEVCRLARQRRPPVNAAPDSSRISRWVSGEQPRGVMPDLLAEALTGLCGLTYPLNRASIGMASASSGQSSGRLPWQPDAVIKAVLETTRSDLTSPNPEGTDLLTGPDLLDAVRPWLDQAPGELPQPDRPGRIGLADVEKIRATTAAFRSWDNQHGGGLSRDAVVAQLKATTELLYHGRMTEAVGRELFAAVGDLASVAGWMTHDAGRSPEGQRYLLLGLRAASEAGDTGLAAHLLNCLARIAGHLGRTNDALEMVQLAQYGTRKLPPGRIKAVLAALEARYLAITGDISGFHRAAGAAADGFSAADPDSDPEWAQWFDAAEYHATIGIAHMLAARHRPGLITTAITMTSQAIPLRPAERARSRAFDHIGLARAHLIARDLDAADHAAATAIDIADGVTSTRLADRMSELDTELAALGPDPAAHQIRDRIRLFL